MSGWTVFVLVCAVGGLGICWWLLRTQLAEDRERRRIQIHDWAMQEDRELLMKAVAPKLFRGYRWPEEPK